MSVPQRILIVDDDPIVADSLAEFLSREGFATATAGDGNEAVTILDSHDRMSLAQDDDATVPGDATFAVVITDMNMPRCDGLELLKKMRKTFPSVVPIMITGFGKIESAVEAIKLGAAEYLTKPIVDDELRIAVNKALRQHALLAENQTLKKQLSERFGMGNLIGSDYRMQKVYDLVEAVAESKTTVMIEGESGTGKTMVARAIHARSPRRSAPFITFSCGSIPETLLESELFGHMKGAFTGADHDKPGKCLAANGGTLFIDEINSATPALQLKLLRVLQEKQFEPIGSTKTIQVDVRFVLATNESLPDLVREGRFREDLFYRINVVNIQMPPLRQRLGDIPSLAEHFLHKYCKESGKTITGFSEEAIAALHSYGWPGNVRELENAVERAVVLSRRPIVQVQDLPDSIQHSFRGESGLPLVAGKSGATPDRSQGFIQVPALAGGWNPTALTDAMAEPEKQIILAALEANQWNRQETAAQLNINRTTLYKKMKQFGLDGPQ
ncbi:MAG: sigma-54 dependent transcriptional regulator [Phycisphaeraceae bacterium]